MAIRVYQVVTRHRVLVVVVYVVTRLRILQRQQTVNPSVLQRTATICAEPTELFMASAKQTQLYVNSVLRGAQIFEK
jgi:hypothetical protein